MRIPRRISLLSHDSLRFQIQQLLIIHPGSYLISYNDNKKELIIKKKTHKWCNRTKKKNIRQFSISVFSINEYKIVFKSNKMAFKDTINKHLIKF